MKQTPGKLVLIFFIISVLSAIQTFTYIARTPHGFVYPLVHNYEQDYYWYLSLMRQGWDGFISVTTKFSPEVFPRVFVNTFFPFFGMVARTTGMSLPVMYLTLRIVFGAGLLIVGYVLLKKLNVERKVRMTAVAFMVFGAPFWFIENGALHQIGEFWTGFDPILRVTWLPHHLAANVCLILSFLFLAKAVNNRLMATAVAAAILAIIGSWCNPATFMILGLSVFFCVVVFILQKGKLRLRELVLFGVLSCLPVLSFYNIQNSTFPWTMFRDWERYVHYPVDVLTYIGVLGLVGVIGFFGIPPALKKRSFLWNLVVGWFLSPFVGLAIIQFVPLSNGRFIQGAGYIPAAILASLFIWDIAVQKHAAVATATVIIGCIILFQLPSFAASYVRQMNYVGKNMSNEFVMVPRDYWDTMMWLSSHASEGIIIAPENVSSLIGALTPVNTFSGHPTFTFEPQKKHADMQLFYFSQDDRWKQEFITIWKPTYLWIPSWDQHGIIEKQTYSVVYANPSVILYKRQ
jgi:hypothetical protein